MSKLFFEPFATPAKLPVKSIEELGAIHSRAIKRLADLQVSIANLGIETNVEQARLLSDTGNYPGFVAAQSALAGSMGTRWIEISRALANVVTETRDELNSWIRKSLEVTQPDAAKTGNAVKPARRTAGRKAA
ncbi:MAG: phasin family protein [Gammaproteobacteria bacterium]|nr:phasin family protein [Gammaproteobacteria bacterium]